MNRVRHDPTIQVRLERVEQLFDSLDPFPFRERDLDPHAEDFIVGWARELTTDAPIDIVVHLPQLEAATPPAGEIAAAIGRHFSNRAEALALDLRELFQQGRHSLLLGLVALAVCMLIAQAITTRPGADQFSRFIQEGLIILGWVANWRPIEIFLHDWWPIRRRLKLHRRLAAAAVQIVPY